MYGGDLTFLSSNSVAVPFAVGKVTPTLQLTPSANAAFVGSALTFVATLSSSADTPTGSVGFYDGTTLLGSSTLVQGAATYAASGLALGLHRINAVYGGDSNYSTLTSSVVQETIEDFSVAVVPGTPNSATIVGSGTAMYQLVVAPTGGSILPASVTLAVSGIPPNSTASLSPQVISSGATTTNATLTIQVQSPAASHRGAAIFGFMLWPAFGLFGLFLTCPAGSLGLGRGRFVRSLFVGLLCVATMIVIGCGSGNQTGSKSGTQPTAYKLTINAVSGASVRSTTVTLNIQ
jgi:hypothetical protein